MRMINTVIVSLLVALAGLPLRALAADTVAVRAILVMATNQKAAADPKLADFEAPLQRNLPESSFRYVGEATTTVGATTRGNISLGNGHRLELDGEKGDGRGHAVRVRWLNGDKVVMNTSLTLQPGVPAVLGRRPSDDGETPIVLVIAK
jgi:hypothetical protein